MTVKKGIVTRYLFICQEFLVEFFDCLGGCRDFLEMFSFGEPWRDLDSVEKIITTAARAIAYLHHATDRFVRAGFPFVPSLNKAVSVFYDLKKKQYYRFNDKYVSRSFVHYRWNKNKKTLALLYAASSFQINRKTLITVLLEWFFFMRNTIATCTHGSVEPAMSKTISFPK